jgi:hypothetical protein
MGILKALAVTRGKPSSFWERRLPDSCGWTGKPTHPRGENWAAHQEQYDTGRFHDNFWTLMVFWKERKSRARDHHPISGGKASTLGVGACAARRCSRGGRTLLVRGALGTRWSDASPRYPTLLSTPPASGRATRHDVALELAEYVVERGGAWRCPARRAPVQILLRRLSWA